MRSPRLWLAVGVALFLAHAARANLVLNGGFEDGAQHWQFLLNNAQGNGQVDSLEHHSGRASFKISNASAWGANIYARIVQTVQGLKPYSDYTVSCWAKGQGCGLNWIGGGPGWYTRHNFPTGDFNWQKVSFDIQVGADADNYELMILSESPTAALWIDDVEFEEKSADKTKQAAVYVQLNSTMAALQERVDHLTNGNNSYVQLGRSVAERFLCFATNGQMSLGWSQLQLEEVSEVLTETEKIAASPSPLFHWTQPKPGRGKYRHGIFSSDGRPYYFYGYGHFDSVFADLSNFPSLGVSLVQDGRFGPSSMTADGKLADGPGSLFAGLDACTRAGVKDDILLSPHYYPAWGQAPDLLNGNIGFLNYNIFHPKAKETIAKWISVLAKNIKDKPALHSICLANEPVYNSSGRDAYTRPLFIAYLKQRHPDLAGLNELYGTKYTNFDQVAVPGSSMPATVEAQRAFYDWSFFNKQMFADWHAWMNGLVKADGIRAPTHTKIMVFFSLDRDKLGWGVDPELMCHATDLAGCDAYAFPGGAYAYDWIGHEFFYDLLHSFRGQSVFNSENHLIPDNSPRAHIPMNHSRAVIWQDGLHHQGSSTIWVWQAASGSAGGLGGSIYFRPANIFGADRAMLDLNRLAPEVTAINQARPRVALLYSPPSVFWEEKYKGAMFAAYTALNFLGEPITFVSERQLAINQPGVEWLVIPAATHIFNTTIPALKKFTAHGGKILLIGPGLTRDEYDRPTHFDSAVYPQIEFGANDRDTMMRLRGALRLSHPTELREVADQQPASGVEFRTVKMGRQTLIPLINLTTKPSVVTLPQWTNHPAMDLLSGTRVNTKSITLEPMLPVLLQLDAKPDSH